MIQPTNGHLLIEPQKHDSFISQDKGNYEEIGIVLARDEVYCGIIEKAGNEMVKIGDKVFFDSYLAAKYPTGKGNEYFWLVKWEDVRAIEKNEEISKK